MRATLILAAAVALAIAAGVLIPQPQPRLSAARQPAKGQEMRVVRVDPNYDFGWKAATPETPKN